MYSTALYYTLYLDTKEEGEAYYYHYYYYYS